MQTPIKFKRGLFGYKKKNVNQYILSISEEFNQKNTALEQKVEELEAKNKDLEEQIVKLEKERAFIADALLCAKQEGEKLVADAHTEAAKIRADLEMELVKINQKVKEEKDRVEKIKSDAQKAIGEYIEKLECIDIDNEQDEYDEDEDDEVEEDIIEDDDTIATSSDSIPQAMADKEIDVEDLLV